MTLHIQTFIDRIQGCDARGMKDFTMSMTDAKNLHADITKLLLQLQKSQETTQKPSEEVIKIQVSGGSFK